MGETIVLSTNDAGTTGHPHAEKGFRFYLMPYTKINSTWIIDENARAKRVKFLGKKIRVNLHGLKLGKDFLDKTPKAQVTNFKNR